MMNLRIQTQTRAIREHSHSFHEKGISSENHPTSVTIQIHSITMNQKPARVNIKYRSINKTVSAIPYAHSTELELSYHSLMFDVVKINILKQNLLSHSKVAQATVKLSELPVLHGDNLYTFALVDMATKSKEVGQIELQLKFEYGEYHQQGKRFDLDIPYVNTPLSSKFGSDGNDSESDDYIDLYNKEVQGFEDSNRSSTSDGNTNPGGRRVVTRASTSMSYTKRSSKEGLQAISQLYAAFTATGWKISKVDFVKGLAAMSEYYKFYPTPRTFDVVTDDQELRIAAYFLNFSHPSYGAAVLNYFGYGKLTDVLKIDQNRKAALAHLKMDKKHMLAWEFDSEGLFTHKPNFFICYDVHSKSIIMSIRGTLGIADAITDINAEYVPFQGGSAHGGSVQSALWIQEHYMQKIKDWIKEYKAEGFYCVGHSLGGAVSSLFYILAKEEIHEFVGQDFAFKSYNFASAPCISVELLDLYKENIYTYINDYDVVPKCSYGSLVDLKELLVYNAELSKDSSISKKERLRLIHEKNILHKKTNKHPRLFLPGKVFFMYKTNRLDPTSSLLKKGLHKNNTGNPILDDEEPHYVVERSIPEHFDDVHFKVDMIFHHFNNKYDNALRKAHDWLVEYHKRNQ
ncbi:hypothetical protein HK103_005918 [Boothiomyces macroporosus]|uniref:sn-1-specific diacylglycerol lipase n=1 Tax=Boothiomyces macroporosus TaxID=261099 RepID=A0AAD5Y5X6_9FUNG|nr:hypothetical protein HK103_005918 [Boothiomyces macroporosus]